MKIRTPRFFICLALLALNATGLAVAKNGAEDSGAESSVVLAKANASFAKGIVKAIDKPSIVILQHKAPEEMLMSIGNPDLDLKAKPNPTQYDRYMSNATKISVILDGIWNAELNENLEDPWQFGGAPAWSVNHNRSEGRTTVSYDARLGRSLNLLLQKPQR